MKCNCEALQTKYKSKYYMFQNVIFPLHIHMYYIDKDIEVDNVTRSIKYIPLIKVFGFDMIIIHIHTYIYVYLYKRS